MAKRLIKEGLLVIRDGKRVRPQIGKVFDLTAEEIEQIERVRPSAIAKLREVEVDPASVPTDGAAEQPEAPARRGRKPKVESEAPTGDAGDGGDGASDL